MRKLDFGGCVSHYHQADKKTLHIQSQGCDIIIISFVAVVFENYLRAKTLSDSIYIFTFFFPRKLAISVFRCFNSISQVVNVVYTVASTAKRLRVVPGSKLVKCTAERSVL